MTFHITFDNQINQLNFDHIDSKKRTFIVKKYEKMLKERKETIDEHTNNSNDDLNSTSASIGNVI
jgi:hypothetical protein